MYPVSSEFKAPCSMVLFRLRFKFTPELISKRKLLSRIAYCARPVDLTNCLLARAMIAIQHINPKGLPLPTQNVLIAKRSSPLSSIHPHAGPAPCCVIAFSAVQSNKKIDRLLQHCSISCSIIVVISSLAFELYLLQTMLLQLQFVHE